MGRRGQEAAPYGASLACLRNLAVEIEVRLEPLLNCALSGGEFRMTASGAWTAANASDLEPLIDLAAKDASGAPKAAIDMSGVREFDTYGAWLLARLLRGSSGARIEGLAEQYQGLLDEVQETNRKPIPIARKGNPILAWLEGVGRGVADVGRELTPFFNMLGAAGEAAARVLIRPRSFRMTSAVNQLDRVGWQATPIILLITFLIGCIIAQQGFFHFRRFGADSYVVTMVSVLTLRELGVLIVAIMVAGRSGSSYTAELGSMKMREEIDALRTMGFDPVEVLVLPRLTALVIALPALALLGSLSALFGAGVVAWLYGDMSWHMYLTQLRDAITLAHFKVGMIKAPFMALVIGVAACAEGMRVKGSAESLGLQTTTSVVKSIFLVIVMDGLFAIFFASIGM
jgi:phospholipid/cholesterol/gamma-HCH transport system permease protein